MKSFGLLLFLFGSLVDASPADMILQNFLKVGKEVSCSMPSTVDVESLACTDLSKMTCDPGEHDDGTGVLSAGGKDAINKHFDDVRAQSEKTVLDQFLKILDDPEKGYFRGTAISAVGLDADPTCKDSTKTAECNQLIAKKLTETVQNKVFSRSLERAMVIRLPDANLKSMDVILEHPLYRVIQASALSDAKSKLQNPGIESKIEKTIFPQVREAVIDLVQRKFSDPELAKKMILKLKDISFAGTECDGLLNRPGGALSSLLVPNAFYSPDNNTFKFCNGFLLSNRSEFQIASIIGHELAHSIDPCNIVHGSPSFAFKYSKPQDLVSSSKEYPFSDLISCLRSEKSIGAKRFEFDESKANAEERRAGKTHLPEPSTSTEPAFCEKNDQIGESVSDWVAAEVTPQYIKKNFPVLTQKQIQAGYSNIFRWDCDSSEDEHPKTPLRVNKIILTNPQVRSHMGCEAELPENHQYCSVPEVKK